MKPRANRKPTKTRTASPSGQALTLEPSRPRGAQRPTSKRCPPAVSSSPGPAPRLSRPSAPHELPRGHCTKLAGPDGPPTTTSNSLLDRLTGLAENNASAPHRPGRISPDAVLPTGVAARTSWPTTAWPHHSARQEAVCIRGRKRLSWLNDLQLVDSVALLTVGDVGSAPPQLGAPAVARSDEDRPHALRIDLPEEERILRPVARQV